MNTAFEFIPLEDDNETQVMSPISGANMLHRYIQLDGTKKIDCYIDNKEYHFPFRSISVEQLQKLRKNRKLLEKLKEENKGILILKYFGEVYYMAIVPSSLSLTNQTIGQHYCTNCNRCYASSDSKGGCAKVRDLSLNSYMKDGDKWEEALHKARRLEKYKFITFGVETINTSPEAFIVLGCNRFVKDREPDKKMFGIELLKAKYELLLHVKPTLSWEEFYVTHRNRLHY